VTRRAAAMVALLLLLTAAAGCGRTARDAGGETVALPETTPVASTIAATVSDPASPPSTPADEPDGETGAGQGGVTDTGAESGRARLADIVSASIEQQGGTLTVHVELARPLDGARLGPDDQVAVGAYLLASADDVEPFAARVLLDGGGPPRFLFGPWLGTGTQIDGTLDGTALTLTVPGLAQGRFRYAQFFAEDPAGSEVLPDDAAGVVPINAP